LKIVPLEYNTFCEFAPPTLCIRFEPPFVE
jgi:hypothetical protein